MQARFSKKKDKCHLGYEKNLSYEPLSLVQDFPKKDKVYAILDKKKN